MALFDYRPLSFQVFVGFVIPQVWHWCTQLQQTLGHPKSSFPYFDIISID
jgi:hypothetical protein